jgi:hypothetical protein
MSHRIAVSVFASLLAGCPGDDDGGGGEGSTTTPDATGSTGASTSSSTGGSTESGTGTEEGSSTGGGSTGSSEGSGSSSGGTELCFEPTLDGSACDPARVEFTLDSTNVYYPLVVGNAAILEGPDGASTIRIERTVLPDTEMVAGVETHVLEHYEYVDDQLVEIARNFYVETTDGVVCYFGEDVENYEGGRLVNTNGTWRAGVDGALPGIIMAADPQVGDAYLQENAPGAALDMGRVESVDTTEMIGDMSYDGVLTIHDFNPLEDCSEFEPKLYVPGIGEAADVDVVLIEFTPG